MSNQTNSPNAKTVQRLWGKEADERVRYGKGFHWVESPLVMAYIQEQITGNPGLDWLAYSYQKYVQERTPPVPRILSLGCGGGALERGLCHLGFHGHIDACDISEGAIEHARAMAAQETLDNIHYQVCDLNQAVLPRGTYSVVFSSGALHHVSNLEHLLDQVRLALDDRGLLIINEYVGPAQLQWTPRQTSIIDELLHLLPAKYRRRVSASGQLKDSFLGPSPIAEMDARDPSEAVRSNEIIPLIRARFSVKELKDFGGTILHMLLQDIVGNFDPRDPNDAGFLSTLIYIEKLLIREKVLGSDFAFLVAEKSSDVSAEIAPIQQPIDLACELRAREVRIENLNERLWQWAEYATNLQNRVQEWASHAKNLEQQLVEYSKHCQNLNSEITRLNAVIARLQEEAAKGRS